MSQLSLPRVLWLSALAGCVVDLFSDHPIGLHALNYTICASLLSRFRRHVSSSEPLHLSLFTGIYSFVSTILLLILLFLFDRRVPFDGKWIFTDIVGMPVMDAVYAFVWFAAPLALIEKLRRIGRRWWMTVWLKRKNLSPTSR
jgi:rod shape-determining protein MreD